MTTPPAPRLSTRGANAPASPIRRLTSLADGARSRGVHVHHLNIGQPDLPTVSAMRQAYRSFDAESVAYSPSQGTAELRRAWAAAYERQGLHGALPPVTADEVLITVGGSEALLFAIAALCDVGEAILVAEPYYTNYHGIAHLLGVDVVALQTDAADGFALDLGALAALLTPRVRAIVLPSPGNPTGAVLDRDQLEALGALARDHGVTLVMDEVYREFVYRDDMHGVAPSALALRGCEAHVVVIDSVSKRFAACGARIGALVTRNRAIYDAALRFAQARLSPPTVDQHAAVAALGTSGDEMDAMIREYRARRDYLLAALAAIPGVVASRPDGAFYLIADLPVDDADAFCRYLLQDFALDGETVMLAPAEGFYATPGRGRSQVRIAYVLEIPALERAVRCLAAGLGAYAASAADLRRARQALTPK